MSESEDILGCFGVVEECDKIRINGSLDDFFYYSELRDEGVVTEQGILLHYRCNLCN